MSAATLPCPNCRGLFVPPAAGVETACPHCHASLLAAAFPALGRGLGTAGAVVAPAAGDEAECFFHAGRPAAGLCGGCGRFLCALCDVEFAGGHWCPKCLADARRQVSAAFPQTRARHDHHVWLLLLLSLLAFPVAVATGPAAVAYALWAWRQPPSLVAASRRRLALAIPLALALTAAAAYFWLAIALR